MTCVQRFETKPVWVVRNRRLPGAPPISDHMGREVGGPTPPPAAEGWLGPIALTVFTPHCVQVDLRVTLGATLGIRVLSSRLSSKRHLKCDTFLWMTPSRGTDAAFRPYKWQTFGAALILLVGGPADAQPLPGIPLLDVDAPTGMVTSAAVPTDSRGRLGGSIAKQNAPAPQSEALALPRVDWLSLATVPDGAPTPVLGVDPTTTPHPTPTRTGVKALILETASDFGAVVTAWKGTRRLSSSTHL